MKEKLPLIIFGATIICSAGFYWYGQNKQSVSENSGTSNYNNKNKIEDLAPSNLSNNPQPANIPANKPADKTSEQVIIPVAKKQEDQVGKYSDEADISGPNIMVYEIVYDGSGFSPAILTIQKGDIVIFKNVSSGSFWPASDSSKSVLAFSALPLNLFQRPLIPLPAALAKPDTASKELPEL